MLVKTSMVKFSSLRVFSTLIPVGRLLKSGATTQKIQFRAFSQKSNHQKVLVNSNCEQLQFDVAIVGAGPSGLATAIKIKQESEKALKQNPSLQPLSVCILEKGSEVGMHILSGNVFEPRALYELFTQKDCFESGSPLHTPVTEDQFHFLTHKHNFKIPGALMPEQLNNHGNYIISLGELCKWLACKAEAMGVEIFPGFPASKFVVNDQGHVCGVQTGEFGISKDKKKKSNYQAAIQIIAKQTILAEGCRGSVSETIMKEFQLRNNVCPQKYCLGLKEIWRLKDESHIEGLVCHTVGWPLNHLAYGGSFLYHMNNNLLHIGLIVGLDYKNPYLNPYKEFQKLKHHPSIQLLLKDGKCLSYGARCLSSGGQQAIPKLTFPGGLMVGCSAGFLNFGKIKGTHTAMKSGIVAGEAVSNALIQNQLEHGFEIHDYVDRLNRSWLWEELQQVRNCKPAFQYGKLYGGMIYNFFTLHLRGWEPWTLKWNKEDADMTETIEHYDKIDYAPMDNVVSFDLLENLQKSGTNHEHDQPSHLQIKPELTHVPEKISWPLFRGPESRFCPAGVYEYLDVSEHTTTSQNPKLVINAQNCIHCKACSIKAPLQFIEWTVPEGGGGPAYSGM